MFYLIQAGYVLDSLGLITRLWTCSFERQAYTTEYNPWRRTPYTDYLCANSRVSLKEKKFATAIHIVT
jgi:hypothetical protein